MIQTSLHQDSLSALKDAFDGQGIVRIFNFLEPEAAHELSTHIAEKVAFKNAFFLNNQNREASDEEIANLSVEERRNLYRGIYQLAGQGTGFLYGRHKVSQDSDDVLTEFLSKLNETSCIDLIRDITGNKVVSHADAQVTRYRVGDFLTRHIDNIPGETRRFAYVLGLSPQWHPDWGGLLQLFEQNGTPTSSYMPVFNSLTVFDVNKVHSVTSVAPFSPQSRYSITGWFRA
ncbi:proline hydroxylase [Thalassotalea sp. M1531]|uniref:Proline hydroxylase n=1 Tax=Thalassotalea algicola TaxID=2716224 RepID=A0A7Y0LFA7_9GAMM|nr:2OG-Fe(II) oxygenase family protein [Thalassotalea algicola]NMP33371.1 proline hydroxylase [Thalassotalea algicola]